MPKGNKKSKTQKKKKVNSVNQQTEDFTPPYSYSNEFAPNSLQPLTTFRKHSSLLGSSSKSKNIDRINELLRSFYGSQLVIRRLFYPDIPIPINSYINLSIVPAQDYQARLNTFAKASQNKSDEEQYEHNTNIYGQIPISIPAGSIIPPSVNLLLNVGTGQTIKLHVKTLVLGAAGIGKSTLSEYCAFLWANEEISFQLRQSFATYKWVFRIPLRNLTEERYPDNQGAYYPIDIIEKECLLPAFSQHSSFFTKSVKEQLDTVLSKALAAEKVLFILDGFDEFPENPPKYLSDLLKCMLSGTVIVTSRPYNLHSLRHDYGFQEMIRLEITGFTNEEAKKYVDTFFQNLKIPKAEEATKLLDFLANNPSVAGACRIPINLELLCSAWEKQPLAEEINTVSGIYDFVTLSLSRRYLQKKAKNEDKSIRDMDDLKVLEECQLPLGFLEHLGCKSASDHRSFVKLGTTRQYFENLTQQVSSSSVITQQKAFGFIRPNNPTGEYDGSSSYYFNHLTFRDFFAAKYIAYCLQKLTISDASKVSYFSHQWISPDNLSISLEDFIRNNRFDSSYELVWYFVTGLLTSVGDRLTLKYFFLLLFGSIDLIEISRVLLLLRCLDEAHEVVDCLPYGLWEYLAIWIEAAIVETEPDEILYNPIWDRMRLCRSIFLHDKIQQTFYKQLATNNEKILWKILAILTRIKHPLPEVLVNQLLKSAYYGWQQINSRTIISQNLASLCNQGLLPIEVFNDIFKSDIYSVEPEKLSTAIEVLCHIKYFEKDKDFFQKVLSLYYKANLPKAIRIASTFAFAPGEGEMARLLLRIKEDYSGLFSLQDAFSQPEKLFSYLADMACDINNPYELRLDILETLLIKTRVSLPKVYKDKFFKSLVTVTSQQDISSFHKFLAYYLLSKSFEREYFLQHKNHFLELFQFFNSFFLTADMEQSKNYFIKLITILPEFTSQLPQLREKELFIQQLSAFNQNSNSIEAPSIKKYVALHLCLNGGSLLNDSLVEKLNVVIANKYTREEILYLTAVTADGTTYTFTNHFCYRDCSPYLDKLKLDKQTDVLSLYYVLVKTPSHTILEFCLQHLKENKVCLLVSALVMRYMVAGKAIYFDEEGLRYFENQKYQLLSLTKEERDKFEQYIEIGLRHVVKMKSPHLNNQVIEKLKAANFEKTSSAFVGNQNDLNLVMIDKPFMYKDASELKNGEEASRDTSFTLTKSNTQSIYIPASTQLDTILTNQGEYKMDELQSEKAPLSSSAVLASGVIATISQRTGSPIYAQSSSSMSSSSGSQVQIAMATSFIEKKYFVSQAVKIKDRAGQIVGAPTQTLDKIAYIKFKHYLKNNVVPYCKSTINLSLPLKVFISYAWPVEGSETFIADKCHEACVVRIAKDLEAAGFDVFLDHWEDRCGKVLTSFVEKMEQASFFLPIGTRLYLKKYEKRAALENDSEHVVRAEGISLNYIAVHSQSWRGKIIPILLEATAEETLPYLLRPNLPLDLHRFDYFEQFFILVKDMYRIGQRDKGYKKLQQNFFRELKTIEAKSPEELEALCLELKAAGSTQTSNSRTSVVYLSLS